MKLVSLLAAAAVALSACSYVPSSRFDFAPQYVVTNLDPARLAGKWYEVASFPAPFVKGCAAATAEYTPQPDGSFAVRNQCRDVTGSGVNAVGLGTLHHVQGGHLRIDLQGMPLPESVWVLDMTPDGKTLVVGTPLRQAGWVLSRENRFSPVQFRHAQAVFERSGYDINSLQRTRLLP